jgi:hypothetical protein
LIIEGYLWIDFSKQNSMNILWTLVTTCIFQMSPSTERQKDRKTERQKDRKTERQKEMKDRKRQKDWSLKNVFELISVNMVVSAVSKLGFLKSERSPMTIFHYIKKLLFLNERNNFSKLYNLILANQIINSIHFIAL